MASAGTAYVDVEARTDTVADAIDSALASIDGTIEVSAEADVSAAEAELEGLEASPVEVPVDADVASAESEIDSLEGSPVEIPVTADTEAAQASIDDLSGSIGALGDAAGVSGAGGALGGLTNELGSLAGATGGVAAGLGVAVGAFGLAIDAAGEAQVVVAQTDSILASLGDSAVVTGEHIGELSTKVMEYSGFSDESVRAGANMLIMFDNIKSADVFDRAVEGAADLAVKMGTDVPGAARLLGMALQDPEAGMGRLRRAGIFLSDAQKEQVASFMEVGDVASAQEVILASLEGRIGTLAETYGDTMKGSMDRAKEAMGELAESAGTSLLPMMEALSDSVVDQTDRLSSWDDALNGALLSGPIQAIAGIGDGLRGVGTVIGELPPELQGTADAASAAAAEMQDLAGAMSDYLDEVVNIPASQRDVQSSITDMVATMQDGESSWFDMADAQDEVITSTANLITKMQDQGASQEELDGVISGTIGMLRSERDAGRITQSQFATLSGEIRRVPNKARTVVETPGLPLAISGAHNYRAELDRIPREITTNVRLNTGRLYADIAGAAASLRSLRDIESASGSGSRQASTPVTMLAAAPSGALIPVSAGVGSTGSAGESAGASIVVNVHGTATEADGQKVVDALRRWQQRNGPVPVRVNG